MTSLIVIIGIVVGIVAGVGGRSRGWAVGGWVVWPVSVYARGFLFVGCRGLVPGTVMEVFLVVRSISALIQSPKFWFDFFSDPLLFNQCS